MYNKYLGILYVYAMAIIIITMIKDYKKESENTIDNKVSIKLSLTFFNSPKATVIKTWALRIPLCSLVIVPTCRTFVTCLYGMPAKPAQGGVGRTV